LKNAIYNNISEEYRRVQRPAPPQQKLLKFHNGDRDYAHWWIDEELCEFDGGRPETPLVVVRQNILEKDRALAHWLVEQDPDKKITWRHVLGKFPEYKTEDTAGRALQRVKNAIDKLCRSSGI
jgi:hypothetical protein